MKLSIFFFVLLFAFIACHSETNKEETFFSKNNSIQKSLHPYNLPLIVQFPIEDEVIGNYKIQVRNELDGFIWYFKKGEDFQFSIEELGEDEQLFEDKINRLKSIDYFANSIIRNEKNLVIFHLNKKQKNEIYLIFRKVQSKGIYFMISTLESGIKPTFYSRMLSTILSIKAN